MFYVDIEDASGNKLGTGPITSAASWRVARPMDGAGQWSFTAPMADVKTSQATPRRYAHIYAYVGSSYQWVGGGPIDAISTSIGADGTVEAEVSGADMLRELAWRSVGSLTISDGAGGPTTHAAALAAVMALAPLGWTWTPDPAPGWDLLYGQFGGETVLAALASVAERSRSHYYLSSRRSLTFATSFVSSGVRCVAASQALGTGQAAITSLDAERSSYDLVSRIIPVGSGQSKVALTLRATGRAAPAGYTLSAASNYLRNDGVESSYGRCERVVAFKDIAPLSSTTADVISAANMLFDAAKYWLDQHSAPVNTYRLTIAECPVLVRPLQTVRVVWRDPAQGTSIDADLYVLAVEWQGDASGVRTAALTVADTPLWPESDVSAVVESITQGTIYQALPQLNANAYVIAYTKNVDDVEQANFRFRFDEDTVQLVRVVFDFQLLPLESTVKSTGASSISSDASGDHSHTVTIAAHTHSVTINSHQHDVTINSHTHTVTIGDHTHSVSVPSHTHGVPNHQHRIGISQGSGGRNVGLFTGGGMYYEGTDVGVVSIYTTSDSGSTTSNSGGSSTPTSGNGGATAPTSSAGGSQTATSTAGGSQTATAASGGGSTPTSASGGSHTHTITAAITTTYGIFRDSGANTFGLTDLEYSLDGSTWYGFAVGVNGFANLSDGWYRVDLTALLQDATTLRPLANNNNLQIRRKSTGSIKKATIDAQLGVRNIIQALALN
jgi:hypothetical protein